MELKNFFAQDAQGNIIPSPTVYLYQPGTTTLAIGLKDAAGAPLANPFTGTAQGQVQLAAPDGDYDLRVAGAGRDFTMRVRFIDVVPGSVEVLRADLASAAAGKGADLVGMSDGGTVQDKFDYQETALPRGGTPSGVASATAGNPNGTYYYRVTTVGPTGEGDASPPSSAVVAASKQINVTIPISANPNVTARKLYRTAAGAAIRYRQASAISVGVGVGCVSEK